jgi:hypothetical protein
MAYLRYIIGGAAVFGLVLLQHYSATIYNIYFKKAKDKDPEAVDAGKAYDDEELDEGEVIC